MDNIGIILFASVAAYLVGSVPTGYLVARGKGIDIRTVGSGNIGATNAFRVLGKFWGTFTLLADMLKGALPVLVVGHFADRLQHPTMMAILVVIAVVVGHNFTLWLRFKGGKGIATSFGALLALVPAVSLIALGLFLMVLLVTRYVSVGSIAAAASLPLSTALLYQGRPDFFPLMGFATILGALAIWRHKSNIQRLLNGTENRIGSRKGTSP